MVSSAYIPYQVCLFLLFTLSFSITFAEIRVYNLNSDIFNLNSVANKMLFIDSFEFTNKGRIELNVSEIYLSNRNLDFSRSGFFLFPTYYYKDRSNPNNSKAGYSFDKLTKGAKSFDIVFSDIVSDSNTEEAPDYSLFFLNHLSAELRFSMVVRTSMYNLEIDSSNGQWTKKNYLSASKILLPRLHLGFMLLYLGLILISLRNIYAYYIKQIKGNNLLRIQIVILVVLIMKGFSLISEIVRNNYIRQYGYSQGFFLTTLAYGSVLFSEVPFATLITLISCGWSYLKPSLNLKEKVILAVVIILHSAMSVDVAKYIQIRPNCEHNHLSLELWWIFRYALDIVVLGYCSYSSYVLLLESAKVEGKAYPSLVKIKLLWRFFFLVFFFHNVKYLYTIYQSEPLTIWTVVLFGEAITFTVYMFVVHMFWPEMLRTDDHLESAAAVILSREVSSARSYCKSKFSVLFIFSDT